jgi:hypothetical protein
LSGFEEKIRQNLGNRLHKRSGLFDKLLDRHCVPENAERVPAECSFRQMAQSLTDGWH